MFILIKIDTERKIRMVFKSPIVSEIKSPFYINSKGTLLQ